MNIAVLVAGDGGGWRMILEQEGIPWLPMGAGTDLNACSCVAAGERVSGEEVRSIAAYVRDGGAVVCSGKVWTELSNEKPASQFVKYLRPGRGSPFSGAGLIDIDAECSIPAGSKHMLTDRNIPSVRMGTLGKGMAVVLPFDPGSLMIDERIARRSFYVQRGRMPHERVSRVGRGGIRKLAARSVEILHHERGLPFVHLWYYPGGAQGAAAFRVDTDGARDDEIRALRSVASAAKMPVSWFVHVKAQERALSVFNETGDEVGVHCYEHSVPEDPAALRADIDRATGALRAAGYVPKGYAAPYGSWSGAIRSAVAAAGFEYSSEFSYAYDDLPSVPRLGALQVPVHPISIGSLRRQGMSEAGMTEYFHAIVEQKRSVRDPLFFYHHPKNGHHPVLDALFAEMRSNGTPCMTFGEFASWWKKRAAARVAVRLDGKTIGIENSGADPDFRLRISTRGGMEAMIPVGGPVSLDALEWKKSPEPVLPPAGIERTRKFNPMMIVNAVEDRITRMFQ